MILRCTCPHEAQDQLHGIGNRVFNNGKKGTDKVSCTACGVEKSLGSITATTAVETKTKKSKKNKKK